MYSGPELGEGFGLGRKVAAERRTAPLRSATFSLVTMVRSMRRGREEGQTSGCREWVIGCISRGEGKPALALRLFAVARVGMTKGSKGPLAAENRRLAASSGGTAGLRV